MRPLFHKVTRPPLPLPLETCELFLAAGTINMSCLAPNLFLILFVLLSFRSLLYNKKGSCTHRMSENGRRVSTKFCTARVKPVEL